MATWHWPTDTDRRDTCKRCGATHTSPETLSLGELRKLAEMMLAGTVAWSPVCQPSAALARGVLRLLGRP